MRLQLALHNEQGQSVVLIAMAIIVLVGMAGLGLDGANAFNQRRNASNAADAAAMAGANALIGQQRTSPAGPSSAVYSAVAQYLSSHGIDPAAADNPWTAYYVDSSGARIGAVSNAGSAANTSARGISVDVQNTFNTWFMAVFGRSTLRVSGSATAIFGPHKIEGSDILPITMSEDVAKSLKDYPGQIYAFGPDNGVVNSGNFGAISLDPSEDDPNATGNPSDCIHPSSPEDNPSYWWCNGTSHDIDIGDWLYGDPGEIAGNLEDEVQYRIDHNPIGLIPVYDTSNCVGGVDSGSSAGRSGTETDPCGGNNAKYRIIGFLVVELTSQNLTGNPKTISAKYKNYIVSTGAIDPSAPVTGLYAINLIKTPGTFQ